MNNINDVKQITFNTTFGYPKLGTTVPTYTLDEIQSKYDCTIKEKSPMVSIFNHGVFENDKEENWNGIVILDIDSKLYPIKFNTDNLYLMLHNNLSEFMTDNFYCIQKSHSGNSFHIFFYFNVEKTFINYRKCYQYCVNTLLDSISEDAKKILTYKTIIDGKKKEVLDSHASSPSQRNFISNNEIKYSNYVDIISGDFIFDIDDYELEGAINFESYNIQEANTNFKNVNINKIDKNYKCEWKHNERWSVANTLWEIYKDYNKCLEELKRILPKDKLKETISDLNTARTSNKKSNEIGRNILKHYGYDFETLFVPLENLNPYNYVSDVTYNINDNQYLSDISIKFDENKINHIYAGCGFGKTYWAKTLSRNNKVCFISPLRSINKDSFENSNFLIVDADHKEETQYIIGNNLKEQIRLSNWSIATTWESFVMYEMYNANFDYVIIDEIHTLNMYDYRINSINQLKRYFPKSKGIKIVMTGTPSLETIEFDTNKININKTQHKVDCEILAYNKSYKGYMYNDIKEWASTEGNYAVIFKDFANAKDDDEFTFEGMNAYIFNSSYLDNVEQILTENTLKSKISMFSVYGQAGINIFPSNNKDIKKIRIYILNYNGLAAIQYANRIREKQYIDKVIIPIKKENISNIVKDIDLDIDLEEAYKKINIINATIINKNEDIFSLIQKQYFKFKYGLDTQVIDYMDGKVVLKENNYKIFKTIEQINKYEKQTQILYNRLINNDFNVTFNYLDEDIKTNKDTKMRTNTFAGKMARFNFNQVKVNNKTNKLYLSLDNDFSKVCNDEFKFIIEQLLNLFVSENKDYKEEFTKIIKTIINVTGSIKKSDIIKLYNILYLNNTWSSYYDNAFAYILTDENWDEYKISAALTRTMYNDITKNDWKIIANEMYNKIKELKNSIEFAEKILEFKFEDKPNNIEVPNDDITKMIYTYIVNQHTSGKTKGKKNAAKKIIIDGIEYESKTDAMNKLNIGRKKLETILKS